MSEAALREGCERLGLEEGTRTIDKLLKIKDFLRFYGRSMNLTGSAAVLDEQILEGLQVVALARRLGLHGRWLDVGSGGGFPALIVAACLDLPLVLVEPRAKRASSLELALAQIGRHDVRVLRGRLEQGKWRPIDGAWLEPGFAIASARAVFSPERWMQEAGPWLREDGAIILHLHANAAAPQGARVLGRVDGEHYAAVAVAPPLRE